MHNKQFNGYRLELARLYNSYSQEYLAGKLGISKSSISFYEKNLRTPKADILFSLGSTLGFPAGFFYKENIFFNSTAVSYRKNQTTKKLSAKYATLKHFSYDIYSQLNNYVELPANQFLLTEMNDVFNLADDDIEKITQNIRKTLNVGMAPINNLMLLLENRGINVLYLPFDDKNLEGFSYVIDGLPFIFLNKNRNWARIRFTLAHELGHLIMHSSVTNEEWQNASIYKILEDQAHNFANQLLLPRAALSHEYFGFNKSNLLALKDKWKISLSALVMRLCREGLITENQKRNFYIQNDKKNEDSLTVYIPERPRLLRDAFELITSNGIDQDELLSEITLPSTITAAMLNIEISRSEETFIKPVFKLI